MTTTSKYTDDLKYLNDDYKKLQNPTQKSLERITNY